VRIVLDTNVLVSGIFFSGPPRQIVEAWTDGALQVVLEIPTFWLSGPKGYLLPNVM